MVVRSFFKLSPSTEEILDYVSRAGDKDYAILQVSKVSSINCEHFQIEITDAYSRGSNRPFTS